MRAVSSIAAVLLLVVISVPSWGFGAGVEIGSSIEDGFALVASLGEAGRYRTENKFGETDNLDAVVTDIWDGASDEIVALGGTVVWVAPTAPRVHSIVSSSLADSGAGGVNPVSTGMRTLDLTGLETWDASSPTTETIVLDGTTAVNTVNSYVIIYRMEGKTWGTGGVNAGSVTATAATDGTITAAIVIGNNQTQMAIYGVSSSMKLRVIDFRASLVKTTGLSLRATGEVLWMTDPETNAVDGTAWTNRENFEVSTDERWVRQYFVPKVFDGPGIETLMR
jgi:hypothetical protein